MITRVTAEKVEVKLTPSKYEVTLRLLAAAWTRTTAADLHITEGFILGLGRSNSCCERYTCKAC